MESQIIEKRERELLEAVKLAFKMFDKKGEGKILPEDIADLDESHRESNEKYFPKFESYEAEDIIEEFHKFDADGGLDLAEYYAIVKNAIKDRPLLEEGIKDAFTVFDRTKNFLIGAEEFKKAMELHGEVLTEDELNDMMTKPGYINGDEMGLEDFKMQSQMILMHFDMEKKRK